MSDEPLFDDNTQVTASNGRPGIRGVVMPAAPPSPSSTDDPIACAVGSTATTSRPRPRVVSSTPRQPRFVVADLDRDSWRMYDGAAVAVMDLGAILRCDVPAGTDWFVAEGCHLVPQGDFSVSAPFNLEQLDQMAAAASYRGVQIRTIPNRRIPRAWSEVEPDVPWADRDKDRDTEIWYRWLTARPERLLSLKRWTPGFHSPVDHIEELRGEVMRDVNMVRQWRQVPDSPQYMDFTQRVNRALLQAMVPSGYDVVSVATRLGCPRKGVMRGKPYWNAAGCIYLDDAYCVARNAKTGDARNLSGRTVRKVCGLHANGYPNQVRSDLRHHAKSLGYTPTSIDRDFVTMVRYLAASGSGTDKTKEGTVT